MASLTSDQIYDLFYHQAHGTGGLQQAQDDLLRVANEYIDDATDTQRLLDNLSSAWTGQASEAASQGLAPVAEAQLATVDDLGVAQNLFAQQASDWHQAKNAIQQVPPKPSGWDVVGTIAASIATGGLAAIPMGASMVNQYQTNDAVNSANIAAYHTYFGQTQANITNHPKYTNRVHIDGVRLSVKPPSPPQQAAVSSGGAPQVRGGGSASRTSAGGGSHGSAAAGQPAPGRSAAGYRPAPALPGGSSTAAPARPGGTTTSGAVAGISPPTVDTPAGGGGGGVPPAGPVGSGVVPSGGSGVGHVPGSIGGAIGGRGASGASTGSGAGSAVGTGGGAGARSGVSPLTSAAEKEALAGERLIPTGNANPGMVGGTGGAGRRDEEDAEHQRKYLYEEDRSLFTADQSTPPTTTGEDSDD